MEYILYIGYLIIGIIWALYIHELIEDDPKYKEGYYFEISLAVNFFVWPICMFILAYSRIFLKRDTLFVDEKND